MDLIAVAEVSATCGRCRRDVELASARAASARWVYAVQMERYVQQLRTDAAALNAQAARYEPRARQAAQQSIEAMAAARRASGGPVEPGPRPPSVALRREPLLSRIPVSVLLQGTGAVLLLAALVAASAVLWEELGAALQSAALLAIVAVTGTIATWSAKRLPTTGAVLSTLTAAAGLTVAIVVPTILPEMSGRWYPPAAALVGTAVLLLTGRALHDRVWWHIGIGVGGLAAGTAIVAVLDFGRIEDPSPAEVALAALLAVPVVAGMLGAGSSLERSDPETARTLRWVGMAGALLSAAGAALASLATLVGLTQQASAQVEPADRWLPAAALTVLALVLRWRARRDEETRYAVGAAALLGPVPVLLTAPAAPAPIGPALVGALVPVVALALLAWLAAAAPRRRRIVPAVVTLVLAASLMTLGYASSPDTRWTWLVVMVWGLGAGVVAIGYGLHVRAIRWVAAGYVLAAVTWAANVDADRFGAAPEWLPLPLGMSAILVWAAARRRSMVSGAWAHARVGQCLLLVSVAPSVALGWQDQAGGAAPPLWRAAVVVAGLAALVAWSAVARSGWALPVAAVAVAVAGHVWIALASSPDAAVDAYIAIMAVVVAAVAAALAADRALPLPTALLVAVGWPLLLWSGLVAWTGTPVDAAQDVRLLAVLAALALVAVLAPGNPSAAATVALVLLAWQQVLLAVLALPDPAPELFTVPAVLAAAITALALRPPQERARIAGAAGLVVLVASSVVAVTSGRLPAAGAVDAVRVGVVVVAWAALALVVRQRPVPAAVAGAAAVGVTLVNLLGVALDRWSEPMPELWTWPSAAALGAIAWLVRRAAGPRPWSLVWIGPPLSLALLPTALVAWADGTADWRVWFALLVGAASLVLGVRTSAAGLVLPGLAALALVAAPVLLRLSGQAPLWVPLSLVGLALLVVGARFEATRRQGRRAVDWVLHLH